jgi:hypothetical protein
MRMVQMAVNEIINVISMRHALVPAVGTVDVAALVSSARMIGRAFRTVPGVALDHVLVNVIAVHVMQMAVVQIIGMAVVLESDVTAPCPVLVRMLFVCFVGHVALPSQVA